MSLSGGFRRIYIRHADKEYANGDADMYKHDPGITESGVEKTKMVAKHLLDQWGLPELIVSSPYRRTRETAIIMNSILENPVPIHIDTELSEYLGNHRNVPIDVTESTLVHEPPHPETFSEMKERVKKHHKRIKQYTQKRTDGIVWIITHGLIIKQIAALVGIKMAKEFPTLTSLSIIDGDTITKSEIIMFKDDNDESDSDSNEMEESRDTKLVGVIQ